MSSREDILNRIKALRIDEVPMPNLDVQSPDIENKIDAFKEMVKAVGGAVAMLEDYENIDDLIQKLYPDAKRIATNIPEIRCATENPDEMEKAGELDGVDVGVAQGLFGVCENGAIWVPKACKFKALYFVSEALVILLDRKELLNNMHEAYKREEITGTDYGYGCFISGPSKTADIEQALVIGAHGARAVTVVLT